MSAVTEVDGSEDVHDFLMRIRELGDRRDKEDEERTRKLEEEVLQGRRKREAQRAERARSLSPTKSASNAGTPTSIRSPMNLSRQDDLSRSPTILQQSATIRDAKVDSPLANLRGPRKLDAAKGTPNSSRDSPQPLSDTFGASSAKSDPPVTLSRAGTLSWQQRPLSRGSPAVRTRPLSMFSPRDSVISSPQESVDLPAADEKSLSREQIAQSLGAKDPTWFRQTRDRGDRSAAYRKQQDEGRPETVALAEKVPLQGLSRDPSVGRPKETSPSADGLRSISPSLDGSIRSKSSSNLRHSTSASLSSAAGFRSPLPTLQSQRFELPSSDSTSSQGGERSPSRRTLAMSPSQGRISPERMDRPPSPTKGLGGFVQSAMLKRSDSVTKRWSAQPGSGLSRENSIASSRSGYEGSRAAMGTINPTDSRPGSLSRDGSPGSSSRPGSSHSNITLTQSGIEKENLDSTTLTESIKPDSVDNGFVKPVLPALKRSPSIVHAREVTNDQISDNQTPASPSKKWSPTKASWLESAIKKPDSPKPKPPPPAQPNWMTSRTKVKQEREDADLDKPHSLKEVAALRSPPPEAYVKPPSILMPLKTSSVENLGGSGTGHLEPVERKKSANLELDQDHGLDSQSGLPQHKVSTPKRDPLPQGKETKSMLLDNPISSPVSKNNLKAESRSKAPSTAEPISQTSPKKDFRSNLKSRRASVGKDSKEEIEFKSVFGKLKRTQTQNYIAPDELKDNILRGKAGLATTGGPKKTEHKDEFKESLLKQREAIKAGLSPKVPPKPSNGSFSNDHKSPVPEAIAQREGLTRSKSRLDGRESEIRVEREDPVHIPESEVEKKKETDRPKFFLDRQPIPRQKEFKDDGTLSEPFTSSLASLLSKGPSPLLAGAKSNAPMTSSTVANGRSTPIPAAEAETGGSNLIHMTKTRARGPKRRLPVTGKQHSAADESPSESNNLVEITRPKSPAHKIGTGDKPRNVSQTRDRSAPRPLANISNNNNRKPSQPLTPRKPSTNISLLEEIKPSSPVSKPSTQDSTKLPATTSPSVKPKPLIHTGEVPTIGKSVPSNRPQQDLDEKPLDGGEPLPRPSTNIFVQKIGHSAQEASSKPLGSTKVGAAIWGRPLASDSTQSTETKSRVKPLDRRGEEISFNEANNSNEAKAKPVGLGIETASEESQRRAPLDRNLPSPPIKSPQLSQSPKSPPLPGKKPVSIANRKPSVTFPLRGLSQTDNQSNSVTFPVPSVLGSYIGEIPSATPSISIGTQTILASSSSNSSFDKIKTLRKQIWEITGHGKSIAVPSHQEHILFENNLYLCTHVFGTLTGTRTTEVYLWCGSGVAESAADDAQIFARKVAKENNGKLLILQQGKETSNFFQALGGIVITRRGSSSRGESPSKSAATYMLCGRRQVGQIAFDEVDFSSRSLCKAFPFIIAARFGKLYLWKGVGSGADELGCARLIGMDLGLTGEIEEVDDGQEPDEFWESLPGGKHDAMTGFPHWHLRPVCEKYITRLFGVEVEHSRPKSSSSFTWRRRESAPQEEGNQLVARVREITPFAQNDLARDGIYVLDAFFEIYIIVPKPTTPIFTSSKSTSTSTNPLPSFSTITPPSTPYTRLRTSLLFAQEYAILSASLEDRPFVPPCTVTFLSGSSGAPPLKNDVGPPIPEPALAPEGLRSAFRKWEDGVGARTVAVLSLERVLDAVGAVREG